MNIPKTFEDKVITKSKYIVVFRKEDKIVLFHKLTLDKVYGNLSLLKFFNKFDRRVPVSTLSSTEKIAAYKLYKSGILVEKEANYEKIIHDTMKDRPFNIYFMYIYTTDRCNFDCKYCYIEKRFKRKHIFHDLNDEKMKRGVDLFLNYASTSNESPTIVFYGGEPLLNKHVLYDTLDYIEENKNKIRGNQKLRLNLVTNGSLLDDITINKIVDFDIRTAISIDGPKEIHDSVRVYKSGRGTYDQVINNYYKLKKTGTKHLYVSLTVGSHNIDRLKEICEFVATKLEPRGVKFNFISPINAHGNPYAFDINANINKIFDAFDVLRDYGIFEDTIGRKLEFFIKKISIQNGTPANGSQITLFPDGSIGPCEGLPDERFRVKLDKVTRLEDSRLFREWNKITVLDKPECAKCPAIGLCGGGHPADAFIKTSSILHADPTSCSYMPDVLRWLIWSYGEKADLD